MSTVEAEIDDLCSFLPAGWKISHPKSRMRKSRPNMIYHLPESASTRFEFDTSLYKLLCDAQKDLGSKKRKSIGREKLPRTGPKMILPRRYSTGKDVMLECAEVALSSFNEKSLYEQGCGYELVEALDCIKFVQAWLFHCNFIARRKNDSEAENMLFFAQVEYSEDFIENDGKIGAVDCRLCCILGPSGIVTGHCGCLVCAQYPGLIQHPQEGEFCKDENWGTLDEIMNFECSDESSDENCDAPC